MKKGDIVWGLCLLAWIAVLLVPATRVPFLTWTGAHPYLGGFFKFAVLATMGDLLGGRILHNRWIWNKAVYPKMLIWGLIGMMVSLTFSVCMDGIAAAQTKGLLPFEGVAFFQALFGSIFMNLTFGPMMMVFHRWTDMTIDARVSEGKRMSVSEWVDRNDWHSIVEFSWLKSCTLFWIPMHTMVFLLPSSYRVLVSAFLSIALGLLLALAKRKKTA